MVSFAAESDDYVRHVKPLLKARCLACHGALQQKAGLRVDTAAAILKGAEGGPVIAAGDLANSPMIGRLEATDLSVRMPPDGKPLTPEEIGHIKAWIAAGAPGPRRSAPPMRLPC